MSRPFILRPVATMLLMVSVLLLGLLGYRTLPVASLPDVDFPTIHVTASIPGASPELMESAVTMPLERQFAHIAGLAAMHSVSGFASTAITLRFGPNRRMNDIAQDVQSAINAAAKLLSPDLAGPPVYTKVNPADAPVLVLAVHSDTVPFPQIADFVDTVLVQKLSQVEGVGMVAAAGGQKPAVRIQVDPAAAAGVGLSMDDVGAAVAASTQNVPKGDIQGSHRAHSIAADDQLLSARAYRDLIVAWRDGAPVRLSDLGSVEDGVQNTRSGSWYNGRPAVIVNVQRQPGANIIATVERLYAVLAHTRAAMPPGMQVAVAVDRTGTIRAAMLELHVTLALTIGLVVGVILAFLRRFWATAIPSVVLPLSLVGTFGVMALAGYSLNSLTLMALTVAAGFVVDDAIVMIENIARHIEDGHPPLQAALLGARQIAFTVVSLTVSLVAVFIPLLFLDGAIGSLFREFAVTLSVAVLISGAVSLTLTPAMCARLLPPRAAAADSPPDGAYRAVLGCYERSLDWVLHRHAAATMLTVALAAAAVWLFAAMPKSFLPQQDTSLILGTVDVADDLSFPALAERQAAVTGLILADPDVLGVAGFAGGAAHPVSGGGQLFIALTPRDRREASADEVIARIRRSVAGLPGASLYMQAVQDVQLDSRPMRTQYQYTLQAVSFDELDRWATRLARSLQKRPEFHDVALDRRVGGQQLRLRIDREAAARLGVSVRDIDNALYSAFGERRIAVVYTHSSEYRVIIEAATPGRAGPAALDAVRVRSAAGRLVDLSAVASWKTVPAALSINRLDQFPAATLSFNLAPGSSLSQALDAVRGAEAEIGMPPSVIARLSGAASEFQASLASTPALVLGALVAVYIVLGILYESFALPLIILSTLPSAGVGALLALWGMGHDLSVIALIGILLLIGIVKKNAIMVIDFAIQAERLDKLAPEAAVRRACLLRFRPIMMTTLAALLGALPLAFGSGAGSEMRQPLGIALAGGLLTSQFLTLYTTPAILLTVRRLMLRRTGIAAVPAAGTATP